MADHVSRVIAQWRQERPDLDPSPQGIIGRLHRIALRLTDELVATYADHGLGEGEFDILATLRRSGPPYALTPTELAAQTMVTSGAITKRVDRCVTQGWVTKERADDDGRGRVVALTSQGRELIDDAFTAHLANEARLLEGFNSAERAELERMLERWSSRLGL
ncbi:MarR family winged helix-turn-helix transcriptional regulator [Nocardioides sp. Kera G14]|uniref:MarR family winged helix-turn-helix transcriptional regulator n=1 Tax=Nocardioides sp. Kera G14 TaxID=2884264 RepID=UPI001D11DF01|nr:MarR family transcriptional regulator [Nocardioides sp. Kera G14]UDY25230.1 MarR family transcriptional regulator [Nocardioides sp. Kera G14]